MAATETIARLVSVGPRWPGTQGERRAAEYLAGELEKLGREAWIEPIRVRPAYPMTHALHAALAVVGSVVSVYVPPLGVGIVLLVAVSMFGDLTGRFHLARRLTPRRRSQNVSSPGPRPDAPARLILTAHHDAARSGLLFARRSRPPGRLRRRLARLASPLDIVFWAVTIVLVLTVVRLFVDEPSTLLTAIQFAPTVLLIASVLLFVDIALSDVVPGASDNASGAAAVLELARRLDAAPLEHLDLWIVFPGAKEGLMLGMREWMRAHADELDSRRMFFVNVDNVGSGHPRFVPAEGFVVLEQHDARLVELCNRIGKATPQILRIGTDGVIARMRGFSAITVCCTDRHGRIPNYHRHSDTPEQIDAGAVEDAIEFVEELVRRIDRELVPATLPSLEQAGAAAPGAPR
jgi:hypothetical protein